MLKLTVEQLMYMINTAMSEARQGGANYTPVDVENWASMVMKFKTEEQQNATSDE